MSEGAQGERGEWHPRVLWVPGHRHADSLPGLVFGKGLLWGLYCQWEGGRSFTFGLSLGSPVPADELLGMSVYVFQAGEHTEAWILPLSLLCNPKQVIPPH